MKRSRVARAVLDAAEGALSAFNAPDRARDAAYARVPRGAARGRCARCTLRQGLSLQHGRAWQHRRRLLRRARRRVCQGLESPVRVVRHQRRLCRGSRHCRRRRGPRARRAVPHAVRMRRLRGNSNHIVARQRMLIHASRLHGRAAGAVGQGSPPARRRRPRRRVLGVSTTSTNGPLFLPPPGATDAPPEQTEGRERSRGGETDVQDEKHVRHRPDGQPVNQCTALHRASVGAGARLIETGLQRLVEQVRKQDSL